LSINSTAMKTQHKIDQFEEFLLDRGLTPSSVKSYLCIAGRFLFEMPEADKATHKEILEHMEQLTKQKCSIGTRLSRLTVMKKYYDFLIESGKRNDHPCRRIFIKNQNKRSIAHTDLLSMEEMEAMFNREERFPHLKLKNQVIVSLLIYQGLLPGEIANVKLRHVDLDGATVYINNGRILSARRLPLRPFQVELLTQYVHKERKRLLNSDKLDQLVIGYQGRPLTSEGISTFVETFRPLFPTKELTSKLIRDSVISYWLNDCRMPLEQVQLLAGHRWMSSTGRYQLFASEKERETINRVFPV